LAGFLYVTEVWDEYKGEDKAGGNEGEEGED
jgi:hypothetical protein